MMSNNVLLTEHSPPPDTGGMKCQYCGNKAKKVMGNVIYPHRKSLWKQKYYYCAPCDAYVSCHQTSNGKFKSMGQLANRNLRKLRVMAHRSFDPLWENGYMTRKNAYRWLASKMELSRSECHIAKFSEEQCKIVINLSDQFLSGRLR